MKSILFDRLLSFRPDNLEMITFWIYCYYQYYAICTNYEILKVLLNYYNEGHELMGFIISENDTDGILYLLNELLLRLFRIKNDFKIIIEDLIDYDTEHELGIYVMNINIIKSFESIDHKYITNVINNNNFNKKPILNISIFDISFIDIYEYQDINIELNTLYKNIFKKFNDSISWFNELIFDYHLIQGSNFMFIDDITRFTFGKNKSYSMVLGSNNMIRTKENYLIVENRIKVFMKQTEFLLFYFYDVKKDCNGDIILIKYNESV